MLPLIVVLAASAALQAPPVFQARVETVYVDIFVTRDGAPVEGLRARNFEVRDDGARQRIELVPVEALPLRTLLVFDTSGSLGVYKLENLRKAAAHLVAGLRPDDPIELLAFDEQVRLTRIRAADDLVSALAPSTRGGTALLDALFAAFLRAGPERTMVIAFTDGGDNMSWLGETEILDYAKRTSAVFHGVAIVQRGLAETAERAELRVLGRVAESTGGMLWTAPDAAGLLGTFGEILTAMRHRYLLRFDPDQPRAGWHRLRVRLRGAKGKLSARPGYWIGPWAR
jgi:VWFA-related protein